MVHGLLTAPVQGFDPQVIANKQVETADVRKAGLRQGLVIAAGAMAMLASPLAAQYQSEGYQFLKAVRDRKGEEATQLLDQPGNTLINSRDVTSGETALHPVVQRRDLAWLRFLLTRGANPNIADRNGVYPIQIAAQLGFIEGVERLIKGGADIDVSDSTGETPLISAVHRRDLKMIEMLIENGASADRTDNSGRSARDYAMLMGERAGALAAIEKAEKKDEDDGESYGPN